MQLVDKNSLVFAPQACAITLQTDDDQWIDTGHTLAYLAPRIYLSRKGVEEAGRMFNMLSETDSNDLKEKVGLLESRIEALESLLDEAEAFKAAVEQTFAVVGKKVPVARKPRTTTPKEVAA